MGLVFMSAMRNGLLDIFSYFFHYSFQNSFLNVAFQRWQRRWFTLFDSGELTWALDNNVSMRRLLSFFSLAFHFSSAKGCLRYDDAFFTSSRLSVAVQRQRIFPRHLRTSLQRLDFLGNQGRCSATGRKSAVSFRG